MNMKRKWDITEVVETACITEPNAEVSTRSRVSRVAGALATSVCAVTLMVGPCASAATQTAVPERYAYASVSERVSVAVERSAPNPRTSRRASGMRDTDTQVGMSTNRLAAAVSGFFQPAREESAHGSGYDFF